MAPKVLVSDKLSESAVRIFRDRGIDVDFQPDLGKDRDALEAVIGEYDGLAIRSATKVTPKTLARAGRLKVIGRAGIGVDNIDLPEASRRGIIVMNTPFGNSVTTAEHAISMMFAVARQIPEASASTHSGKWEKSRFIGKELTGKTLGVIGCGNIGSIVCDRAQGLKMKVLAYDPYLSQERAGKMGVEKLELDELLSRADFVSLHVPLTDKTRNIIGEGAIGKMRKGAYLINCARGGLVDEEALAAALRAGSLSGAALDVFEREPATEGPLFNLPGVVLTPHLGASTVEAQENVALQVAEQMSDFLLRGAVSNALNMPSIAADEAPALMPWVNLSKSLGSFVGQMTDEPIQAVNILYNGSVSRMNLEALNASCISGIIKSFNPEVNMVSAPVIAKERGVNVSITTQDKSGVFDSYIKVTMVTEDRTRSIAGTVFSDGKPRFIQIKGINLDAAIGRHMLYVTNQDQPGIIGLLGKTLGDRNVNIASFTLGRSGVAEDAIGLLDLDLPAPEEVVRELRETGKFQSVRPLEFDAN